MALLPAIVTSDASTAVRGRVRQIVARLESATERQDANISSRRTSTSSSNSLSSRSSRNNSSSNYSDNAANVPDASAGPRLRRVHGRLIVSPEDYETLPQALPTLNFYRRFPRAVGPLANVVVTTPEEYKTLLSTCEPVEVVKSVSQRDVARNRLCQEDIEAGGFFVYQPKGKQPQYFKSRDVGSPSDVYGTSTYIQV